MIFFKFKKNKKGQSLIELILAIALGVIFIGVAALVIAPILKINTETNEAKVGGALARELMENTRLWVEADWHNLDGLGLGPSNTYFLSTSTDTFASSSGVEEIVVGTTTYQRYFFLEDLCRDNGGEIQDEGVSDGFCSVGEIDSSLVKVSVGYSWAPEYASRTFSAVLARFNNRLTTQTDWSGGPGSVGATVATTSFDDFSNINATSTAGVLRLSNISTQGGAIDYLISTDNSEHWAWNDLIGWIDFNAYSSGDYQVKVNSLELRGAASSSWGPIYLNCATSPYSSCNPSFKVTNQNGALGGHAWNDIFGWLSFHQSGYARVLVESRGAPGTAPSDFENWAWSPVIGWVSFNCKDISWEDDSCGDGTTIDYKVTTDWYASSTQGWLTSAIFDTGKEQGARFNSILWRGELPAGTAVKFQFAVGSDESDPFNFSGPDGTGDTYYNTQTAQVENDNDPDYDETNILYSAPLNHLLYGDTRYFRYKIFLVSNSSQLFSPVVKDVIVNWSP